MGLNANSCSLQTTCLIAISGMLHSKLNMSKSIDTSKMHLNTPGAYAAVHSKAMVLLLIHCVLLLPFVGVCVWSLFCYLVLRVLPSFALIFLRKSDLTALL